MKASPKPVQKHQGGDRANRDVYDTQRWRKVRRLFLDANPLCYVCQAQQQIVEATVVDHHVPINDGADPWDESNWRPMCARHHNAKRATERRDRR